MTIQDGSYFRAEVKITMVHPGDSGRTLDNRTVVESLADIDIKSAHLHKLTDRITSHIELVEEN